MPAIEQVPYVCKYLAANPARYGEQTATFVSETAGWFTMTGPVVNDLEFEVGKTYLFTVKVQE